jgi:hypothetical protein
VVGDVATPRAALGALSAAGEVSVVTSDERMSLFLPVSLHPRGADSQSDIKPEEHVAENHHNTTWISTLSEGNKAVSDILEKNTQTFDMFAYLSFCGHELQSEVRRAEERRQKAELSGEEFTPRTISQVRRARTSELANSATTGAGAGAASNRALKASRGGRDRHLLDVIATAEVERNEATVAIAWSCLWGGKLHRGLNVLHHQKLFKSEFLNDEATIVSNDNAPVPSMLRGANGSGSGSGEPTSFTERSRDMSLVSHHAADRLTVTLVAPPAVAWDFQKQGRCPVAVSLDIYSNHPNTPIVVSVEALEWLDLNADVYINPNKSNTTIAKPRKRPPVKGLRWEGKSRFVDVVVPPLTSISLPFLALISKNGVFDMKRYVC